jgi:hypothetical protein
MEAHQLAEIGKTDTLPVPRDLLENGKRPAERLYASALAIMGIAIGHRQ